MLTNRLSRTFPSPTTQLSTWVTVHDSERTHYAQDVRNLCLGPDTWKSHLGLVKTSHCGSCYIMLHFRLITNRSQDVNLPTSPFYPVAKAKHFDVAKVAYTAWRKRECLVPSKLNCVAYGVRKWLFGSCLVLLTPCRCDCPVQCRCPYNSITSCIGKRT